MAHVGGTISAKAYFVLIYVIRIAIYVLKALAEFTKRNENQIICPGVSMF